jgi:hypothetical protein
MKYECSPNMQAFIVKKANAIVPMRHRNRYEGMKTSDILSKIRK